MNKINSTDFKLDVELDIDFDEDLERLKEEIEDKEYQLRMLSHEIEARKTEVTYLEKKSRYYGGFRRYLATCLNSSYHTMILVGFMFLGYLISGMKYVGFKIWKAPTSIVFYIVFSIGFLVLSVLEYIKFKKEGE